MSIFSTRMHEYKMLIDDAMVAFFDSYADKVHTYTPSFQAMFQEITRISLLAGAKRIRPILVLVGYELQAQHSIGYCKSHNPELYNDLIRTALSLELFHTFALVHDDIIDESHERRGERTIEEQYRHYFSKQHYGDTKEITHLAQGATILAGDLLYSMADSLMNQVRNGKVRSKYFDMQFELIAGQVDDCFGVGLTDLDTLHEDEIIAMMVAKSGSYSITNPLLCGMLLAGVNGNHDHIQCITDIGRHMGIIFQLSDDLLGLFGDEEKTGKSTIGDIIEGKKTLIMFHTYHNSSDVEKTRIRSILGNKDYKMEEIIWLKKHCKQLGIDVRLTQFCIELKGVIRNSLVSCYEESDALNFLIEMSEYLVTRTQ